MKREKTKTAPAATEVDAYVFIKESLKRLGWDTRNPERNPSGQVYTQNECLSNAEIKRLLGLEKPENIVKVTEKVLWVIEAKRSHQQINQAVKEAEQYARKLNQGKRFRALFISGVAGNEFDSFLVQTFFLVKDQYKPVQINNIATTGLLSPQVCETLLSTKVPNIADPPIDERLFITTAERINEILHLGAVNPHLRSNVISALLLSMLSSTRPNIEERSTSVLIDDINARVRDVLERQGKSEFASYIKIPLPAAQDNHLKFRRALVDTIQELHNLNIHSAMQSGADWLGTFYEVFLKYARWAKDLGIVLTPRHVTKFAAEVLNIGPQDIIYDPTCGTGGFLVAAFDVVKKSSSQQQIEIFKQYAVFGLEQDDGVAALAIVNMIFRGDGKNNIHQANCFAKHLAPLPVDGVSSATYVETPPASSPPVTRVLMNPPFALKKSDEKEYKFIDQALKQMVYGGMLFCILPYSAMVRPGAYQKWRQNVIRSNTLRAVVTFPIDLFYPVGVNTVGVFIQKGIPHSKNGNVLWIRALTDGYLKSKGKRLPSPRTANDLEKAKYTLKAFLNNPNMDIASESQYIKTAPIDFNDSLLELVPEAYLDQAPPTNAVIRDGIDQIIRDAVAFLIRSKKEDDEQK